MLRLHCLIITPHIYAAYMFDNAHLQVSHSGYLSTCWYLVKQGKIIFIFMLSVQWPYRI